MVTALFALVLKIADIKESVILGVPPVIYSTLIRDRGRLIELQNVLDIFAP